MRATCLVVLALLLTTISKAKTFINLNCAKPILSNIKNFVKNSRFGADAIAQNNLNDKHPVREKEDYSRNDVASTMHEERSPLRMEGSDKRSLTASDERS